MRLQARTSRTLASVISLASALVALYAMEAFLLAASPGWMDRLGTTLRGGPSVISETHRLRQRGIQAYPFLQSDLFTYPPARGLGIASGDTVAPLSGIASELTVLCNESGTTIGYRSDSLGFRNSNSRWRPAPRAALIGDSFTHGFCRPENETIDARLASFGIQSVNAGMTGAGPLTELAILKEYLAPLRPLVVYWLFYEGNDLLDLESERKTLVTRYLDAVYSQRLRERRTIVNAAMKRWADSTLTAYRPPGAAARTRGFITLRKLRTATGLYRGPEQPEQRDETASLDLLEQVLGKARDETKSWNGELRLVYLPERRRFNKSTRPVKGENHDPLAVHRAVSGIAARLGIPMVDASKAFAATRDPRALWNNRRYHYNAAGYRVVADAIAADLARPTIAGDTASTTTRAVR